VIRLLVVGKLKAKWARLADEDYRKRLTRFTKLELVEIADADPAREGRQMLAKLGQEPLICCDPGGETWTSEDLARRLGQSGSLSFCIGGPEGLSREVLDAGRESFAFGRVTLPHELARITLLEQLYRGYTILGGHPYHR
jgi:23S rRNA (pseudouridine1915-N3)-methyltransferase